MLKRRSKICKFCDSVVRRLKDAFQWTKDHPKTSLSIIILVLILILSLVIGINARQSGRVQSAENISDYVIIGDDQLFNPSH